MIEFVRSRHIAATQDRIWPSVADIGAWPRWHHEAERGERKPGSVVFTRDATAEVTIAAEGGGSRVTYRLLAEPGSLLNTFMLRVMAPGPIGRSFETSLAQLAALVEPLAAPS